MIKIYTTPSCSSCRKAKKWLSDNNIPYEEKNIFAFPLTKEDIELMLKNTENGFEDIISMKSKYMKENNVDIDSMKTSELMQIIIDNPSVLKRPIIVDDNKMQVGYNDDDIRVFIPREVRMRLMATNCDTCDMNGAQKLKEYYCQQVSQKA